MHHTSMTVVSCLQLFFCEQSVVDVSFSCLLVAKIEVHMQVGLRVTYRHSEARVMGLAGVHSRDARSRHPRYQTLLTQAKS
jgi:hypothetical protein